VTFSIGRIRRADEPIGAGWGFAEQNVYLGENFVNTSGYTSGDCPPEAGCSEVGIWVRRATRLATIGPRSQLKPDALKRLALLDTWLVQEGDDEDEDWTPGSEDECSDDEPLEWDEDWEDPDNESDASSLEDDTSYSLDMLIKNSKTPFRELMTLDRPDPEEAFVDDRPRWADETEHIAGPGCRRKEGYNGNNVSAEEMIGSCTVQCLVRKDVHWRPEPTDSNDEEFKPDSKYFLSGLGGHMQSRDMGGVKLAPRRYNLAEEQYPDDQYWHESESEGSRPMPFHPACFEVFKRVSRLRTGFVNINGLGYWRWYRCQKAKLGGGHAVSSRGFDQWWQHVAGEEWLAANPVLVPRLPQILSQAVQEDGVPVSTRSSAFQRSQPSAQLEKRLHEAQDCFHCLPQELKLLMIGYLDPKDIAALRCSSRAFTHLPISLWKQLLQKEMPWLWEVYDDTPPSNWAATPYADLKEEIDRIEGAKEELRQLQTLRQEVLKKEMPEIADDYYRDHPWILENIDDAFPGAFKESISKLGKKGYLCTLPRDKTNWYEVYTLITRHWSNLKGLQNRRRIWDVCEEIVRQIQAIVEDGLLND
jgi:hypothetical protein